MCGKSVTTNMNSESLIFFFFDFSLNRALEIVVRGCQSTGRARSSSCFAAASEIGDPHFLHNLGCRISNSAPRGSSQLLLILDSRDSGLHRTLPLLPSVFPSNENHKQLRIVLYLKKILWTGLVLDHNPYRIGSDLVFITHLLKWAQYGLTHIISTYIGQDWIESVYFDRSTHGCQDTINLMPSSERAYPPQTKSYFWLISIWQFK